jgi:hypothetical protein
MEFAGQFGLMSAILRAICALFGRDVSCCPSIAQ